MKELIIFISDADLQASSLALKVARFTLQANPQTQEAQDVIARAATMANSQLIQGSAL